MRRGDHRARRHDHPPSIMYSIAVNPMLSPTAMMLGIATKFQIAMQGTAPISHIDSYRFRNQVAYLNNPTREERSSLPPPNIKYQQ